MVSGTPVAIGPFGTLLIGSGNPGSNSSDTDGGVDVELIGSEDGVSPGQACAFYDAADGQARVLGGGIIASTVAAPMAERTFSGNLAAAH